MRKPELTIEKKILLAVIGAAILWSLIFGA